MSRDREEERAEAAELRAKRGVAKGTGFIMFNSEGSILPDE